MGQGWGCPAGSYWAWICSDAPAHRLHVAAAPEDPGRVRHQGPLCRWASLCVCPHPGEVGAPWDSTSDPSLLSTAGFLPRIIKAAPSCAIMISTYEFGKSFFQRLNREQLLSP